VCPLGRWLGGKNACCASTPERLPQLGRLLLMLLEQVAQRRHHQPTRHRVVILDLLRLVSIHRGAQQLHPPRLHSSSEAALVGRALRARARRLHTPLLLLQLQPQRNLARPKLGDPRGTLGYSRAISGNLESRGISGNLGIRRSLGHVLKPAVLRQCGHVGPEYTSSRSSPFALLSTCSSRRSSMYLRTHWR